MKKIRSEDLQEMVGDGVEVFDETGQKRMRKRHLKPAREVKEQDPLEAAVKQVVEIAHRSDMTMAVVLKTLTTMLKTLSGMNRDAPVVMPEPKLKEWEFNAVRIDSKTVNITAKQIK